MVQLPEGLIERLRQGRCVLCAGAGLRALAGVPSWQGVLSGMADRLAAQGEAADRVAELKQLLVRDRLFLAAGYLSRRLGAEAFMEVARDALRSPTELPEPLRQLRELPFRTIVSMGRDDLLEHVFDRDGVRPGVLTLADGRDLRREARSRMLLKLMGDIMRPETVCLTAPDFERALAASPGSRSYGEELAKERSLLFIGFAPEDFDFELLLERFFTHAGSALHEHYAILPGAEGLVTEELYARYRLRVLGKGTLEENIAALRAAVGQEVTRVIDEDDLEGWLHWLALEPDNSTALAGLLRLEHKARDEQDWQGLVEVLVGRAENTEPGPARGDLLREVAHILEQRMNDPSRSLTALLAALREEPERAEIIAELERLATVANLWQELVADYGPLAQASEDPARLLQLGRWVLDRLGQVELAITVLEQARRIAPERDDIAEALSDALRAGSRWGELVALLEQRIERCEGDSRHVELLLLLGDVYETRTHELDKAIASYRRAAELPDGDEALAPLERIFRRRERWKELVDLLGERAGRASDRLEARALSREAAEILADRLGDVSAAVARLEAVAVDNADDTATLRALERLYEKSGRSAEYQHTLARLVDASDTDEERVMLLRRLAAECEEQGGATDRAAEYLERILMLRPRDDETLRALERIYRAARKWGRLVETLDRHVAVVLPNERLDLLAQMGRVFEEELKDAPSAVEAYMRVTEAGGDAARDLARLHQQTGDWRRAREALADLATKAPDPAARANLWYQAAQIAEEKMCDDQVAEAHLAKALEAAPTHLPSMMLLVGVYERRGEWLRAAKLKTEAGEQTTHRLDKARLCFEAGKIYEEQLEHEDRALELYAYVLALDPEHVPAATRLAIGYEKRERWAELEPVLDMLAQKTPREDLVARVEILSRLAYTARRLGNDEKARKVYQQAFDSDGKALPVLAGLAGVLLASEQFAEAARIYQAILSHHGDDLSPGERLDVHFKVASCEHKQGNLEAAIASYDRAIKIDPHHQPSLTALVDIHAARGRWREVIDAKSALASTLPEDDRGRVLEEIGDVLLDKIDDPVEAMAAYQSALEYRPNRALLLHKVLDLYTQHKQWRKATQVIQRLSELETAPTKRAKYRFAEAMILKDELAEEDVALERLEQVLDDAADTPRAFEAVEEIYEKRQDWKGLERAYRRMIKRLPSEGMTDVRLRLWSNLGQVALEHLGNREEAIAALEVAKSLDPGSTKRHEQLADLFVDVGPDGLDKAIAEHQWLIARQPDRLSSYQVLRRLYEQSRQWDKMWCICAALKFLKRADPEETAFFEKLRPRKFVPAKRKLTEEVWQRHVIHPDENRVVDAIFTLVGPPLAALSAQPHRAFGLNRKDRTDPASDEHLVARVFRYAVEALGVPGPELYIRPEQAAALQVANAIDKEKQQLVPAFIVGQALLDRPREKEIVFELAKRLSFMRPERYVWYALPTPQALSTALRAGLAATGASNGAPLEGDVRNFTEYLQRVLPPAMLQQLGTLSRKLVESKADASKGEVVDVNAWLAAADLTGNRVAFALTNDFEVAARMVSTDPSGVSPLSPKERLKDLLAFSVSEDYFAIRRQLGTEVSP